MIVSDKHKFVFVSTMRCGTHTMFNALQGPVYQGYHEQRHGGYHNRIVPPRAKDWFTFAVSRNPYSRLVSIWRVITQGTRYRHYTPLGKCSFPLFACWCAAEPNIGKRAGMLLPQGQWLDGIRLDTILRLEDLDAEVKRLPFWTGPDHVEPAPNRTCIGQPHWSTYYSDPEIIAAAQDWAGDDFETYGYQRTIETEGA